MSTERFTAEEKAAMKETAAERKAAKKGADAEAACLEKIAEMAPTDRAIAERLHALVKEHAQGLEAKTWYGMPAYANKAGKVVVFFQSGQKFKTRYATIGFQEAAHLDEGTMWPTSYAVTELTPEAESRLAALILKAIG